MRLLHAATALAATSALALALTACGNGGGNDTAGDQPSASTSSSSATASDGAPAENAGATKDAGSSTGGSGSSTGGGTATGGSTGTGTGRCHTAGLGFSFGSGDGKVSSSDDQQHLAVVLKNKTSAACTIQGFPGVDLKSSGGSWSLTRSGATPKKVTLAAGSSATFTISFLPWTQGSGTEFKATSVVVTPPNETTSATLTWPGGSVLLQDGATHPGTYTGPVGG
ncbi:DUF4232 domain-containing protein [Streptomyces sp. MBT65]|uniref:DUF4232 domain-containing protein n=1 Tax=Streptomyces sp. MBT65 TaxID=1488395 RepID=UPI00190B41A8|nr:DUF4232 domain-containing protein [Streptomyces sp. MBT65]MBK3580695.1 DUF4232 domain-containing protein [Streptomyces sp. MBT65]